MTTRSRRGSRSVGRSPTNAGSSSADVVRTSMPADVAKQLASFGTEFDGEIAGQTAKIYASQPRVYEAGEIKVTKNLAYGPHERQQVDIHTATVRRSERPVPVVVVFHGGGLIGGSRAATANVADYFASLGYVGVNGSYRLAPDAKWPEGARDVGAAVTWLKSHAAEYSGDPEQIFVVGSRPARTTPPPTSSGPSCCCRAPRGPRAPFSCRAPTPSTSSHRRRASWSTSARTRSDGRRW